MSTDISIPGDLWDEDVETVITNWLVSDGTNVSEGTLVAEIMTAKVQYEIHAPTSGSLRILKEANSVVEKGTVIGKVE